MSCRADWMSGTRHGQPVPPVLMTANATLAAKITRPAVSGAVHRKRLFELLDAGEERPVTWVSSPAGSGKSTLVASYLDARKLPSIWYKCDERDADLATFFYYMGLAAKKAAPRHRNPLPLLTPEYLTGVPTFTRRYFEQLYSRLMPGTAALQAQRASVVVLENYQDVPAESPFHDMIATGLDAIPHGVRVVVISRGEPPAPLVRMQANGKINLLDYTNIRFTLDESRELAHVRMPALEHEHIVRMHEKTEGWAAGMILMLERGMLGETRSEPAAASGCDRVFDYFAEEIFNRTEKGIQDFLLKTAFLPVLSVPLAEKLAATASAGQILARLHRHNLFTERLAGSGQQYQYHPLFKDFLLNRANHLLAPGVLAAIRRKAAWLLEQTGQVEEAARLYCDASDQDGLARMVMRHARELLQQGRNRTVREWIACLPGEPAGDDPWIAYWSGMCHFPLDLPHARRYLERAFASFRENGDASGIYLSWAGIVDTHAFGYEWKALDGWITVFEELVTTRPFPSPDIELIASSRMLSALTLRKTDQPNLIQWWLRRVSALQEESPSFDIHMDTVFYMNTYYLWKGEYDKGRLLLERAEAEICHRTPSPFIAIRIKLLKGIYHWIAARHDAAVTTLSEGLDISAQSGVHVFDSLLWCFRVSADLVTGNMERAELALENQLASLPSLPKALDVFFYHVNRAWHALLNGKPALAAEHLETISAKTETMGIPYYRALWHICTAQVAFLQGRTEEAQAAVRTAHHIGLAMKSRVMEWYALLIDAWFLLREGKETEGLTALQRGLSLGRRHGYIQPTFYQPAVMRFLYAKALEEGIEPDYVTGLIRILGLTPPQASDGMVPACCPEEWPYRVRITTLGRFEVLRDDQPLHVSGKEQKKPLELLKALIAFGGSEVPVARLTDAVWPDADGDLAHKSFEMTLSRLRRLLGGEHIVTYRARQLTIDPLYCRVDSLALESLLEKIPSASDDHVMVLCEKAISLYKGPFLPGDTGLQWAVSCRDKLRNKLLRVILTAGRQYEQAGEWERAAGYYSKGIEMDNLAEEFYRRLMICHCNLGNHADAGKTYKSCCRLLQNELGMTPSPETTAVYSAIIQNP